MDQNAPVQPSRNIDIPRVSIVIPIYQGERYVGEIVNRCNEMRKIHSSLVHELIFVCDEPIDDSEEVILSYCEHNSWVRIVPLGVNYGQHVATSVGLLYSDADWIFTLDEDLQCDVCILPDLIMHALSNRFDLVYVLDGNKKRGGRHGYLRNINSEISKKMLKLITRDDYTSISSFRLVRASTSRSIAHTIDRFSYLDASLMSVTSPKRRGIYKTHLKDQRTGKASGYGFRQLVYHYGRFLTSVNISGLVLLQTCATTFLLVTIGFLCAILANGIWKRSYEIVPGWTTLLVATGVVLVSIVAMAIVLVKLLSVLIYRSSGHPGFVVIDRGNDSNHLAALKTLLSQTTFSAIN